MSGFRAVGIFAEVEAHADTFTFTIEVPSDPFFSSLANLNPHEPITITQED